MNAARVKGSHAAIKSGMLCAEALVEALAAGRSGDELVAFPELFKRSWLYGELQQSRNFKPWFKKGPLIGELMTGVEHWLTRRKSSSDRLSSGKAEIRMPISTKPPVCNGMIAPRDSWMMPHPCDEMIPPGAPRLLAE